MVWLPPGLAGMLCVAELYPTISMATKRDKMATNIIPSISSLVSELLAVRAGNLLLAVPLFSKRALYWGGLLWLMNITSYFVGILVHSIYSRGWLC